MPESTLAPVTAMVFTLDEALHLPSCLAALEWCDQVIVVDSFSTDNTCQIAEGAGALVLSHAFEGFGSQRNWALEQHEVRHEWVLILDADERVPPGLAEELAGIAGENPADMGAYRVRRRFYMWGKWLKYSGLYPSWVVRFVHKDKVRYVNRGHAETQQVDGETGDLQHDLIDENLKGIDEWFERQNRYSRKESDYEMAMDNPGLSGLWSGDPLKRRAALKYLLANIPFRASVYFLYSYILRGGFLDGAAGYHFCKMKSVYQQMIATKKFDSSQTKGGKA